MEIEKKQGGDGVEKKKENYPQNKAERSTKWY